MAIYTWDTSACLFYAERGSYQEKPEPNVREFKTEVGPPKRRPRSSIPTMSLQFNMKLSGAHFTALVGIFRNTLFDGTMPFYAPHPRTGVTTKFEFREEYEANDIGHDMYQVSMKLRTLP